MIGLLYGGRYEEVSDRPVINWKGKFARLIIKNKHPVSTENTVNNNNADE